MNKNISFFIAIAIFNFTFAEETTVSTETSTIVTRSHNLMITIQPKDMNDIALFDQKAQDLFNMIQTAHRTQDGSNLYNKILAFIKETQEAIIAGLNLFATTTNNSNSTQIIQAIEEVVAAETPVILDEPATETTSTIKEVVAETTQAESKNVATANRNIEININISLENPANENLFNVLIEKMNDLAQAINTNSRSAEDVTNMLNDIILASQHLPNTNLTIKIN